ncbi:hypothetical protein E6P00_02015 (plasmid) [Pseudomonas aeruginosa]|nr:hypothetical protein E6P00_02015 [Pseudomonas aeruginosa]
MHLAFLCFTHLLSSFRGRQLKLPRSHCLKRWIHYKVIYPYSDEDDYRMTKHDLLKVIQESSNVQKAEIAVEGVKVTYSCQQPVTKS